MKMPSREEIASWLRYAADEILNPYRPIPKETRIAIGVQQIIDEIRNHAIQVENMRCENCAHSPDDISICETDEPVWECIFVDGTHSKSFGCWNFEPKEVNK